jgi:hypothetical protein
MNSDGTYFKATSTTTSVSTVSRLRAGWPGFNSRHGKCWNFFLFSTAVFRPALGSNQPPIQWILGAVIPGVKRPGYEGNHSHTSRDEVKNVWSYVSIPPIRLNDVHVFTSASYETTVCRICVSQLVVLRPLSVRSLFSNSTSDAICVSFPVSAEYCSLLFLVFLVSLWRRLMMWRTEQWERGHDILGSIAA